MDKKGTILGSKKNNILKGNGRITNINEFIIKRQHQDIIQQKKIKQCVSKRLQIEDLLNQFKN